MTARRVWRSGLVCVLGAVALGRAAAAQDPAELFRGLNGRPGIGVTLLQGGPGTGTGPGEHQHPTPAPRTQKPGQNVDLTELSLEQLLEQEIIPINVQGGHTHPKGQWMVGYRYMFMRQAGNLDGTRDVSTTEILKKWVTAPLDMDMEMHMLEAMYAPSERLTLMAMVPYKRMWMDSLSLLPGGGHGGGHGGHSAHGGIRPSHTGGGGNDEDVFRVEERSAGWGDVSVMGLYTFWGDYKKGKRLLLNGGVSFPSGSIKKGGPGHRHEYMMQLGSGTVDLQPGLTYLQERGKWAVGSQVLGTVRLGRNDVGYALGNQVRTNAWVSYSVRDWLAPSLRLEGNWWGNVRGRDPLLDPLANPNEDPRRQGGKRLDLLLGLNLFQPKGKLKGTRLTLEGGIPIYQSLDGPQLETDWQISLGASYTW
jgi:hypothetical protein